MKLDKKDMLDLYLGMVIIRRFEEKLNEIFRTGLAKGSSHFSVGEEAISVGVCSALRKEDYILTDHRGHADAIAKGVELKKLMAEICCKQTGLCKGKSGSMHMVSVEAGFLGANGIVGAGLPIATGVAFAVKYRGSKEVVVSFFGDGASNTGAFHEAINLSAIWQLPIVFVCKNNLYAISTPIREVCLVEDISKRVSAYGIPGVKVDGNDVIAVREVALKGVERARSGGGPTLIECKSYRLWGHSKSDPMKYRTKREVEEWWDREPLVIFRQKLINSGLATNNEIKETEDIATEKVEEAARFTLESPNPDRSELHRGIYAE